MQLNIVYKYKYKHPMNKKSYGCFDSHCPPKAQRRFTNDKHQRNTKDI